MLVRKTELTSLKCELLLTLGLLIITASNQTVHADSVVGSVQQYSADQILPKPQPRSGSLFQLQLTNTAPIKGGIVHSESLPPVEPNLRPGMPFDEKNLPPLDTEEGWFLIPEWGAGTWHKD